MPIKILLVDDEEPLRVSLGYALTKEGFEVATAEDGHRALELAAERPDAIILDVMLPGVDGHEVCRRIRLTSDVPIIMLTARDHSNDKVSGLDSGADDYVTKPFNTRELVARVRAVLRRRVGLQRMIDQDRELVDRLSEMIAGQSSGRPERGLGGAAVVEGGRVKVDVAARRAVIDGRSIDLQYDELRLLHLLVSNRNQVMTRTELIETLWGAGAPEGLVQLEAQVRTLREKIESDPGNPGLLLTVPGIGYQLA